jgi:hypothetical protein
VVQVDDTARRRPTFTIGYEHLDTVAIAGVNRLGGGQVAGVAACPGSWDAGLCPGDRAACVVSLTVLSLGAGAQSTRLCCIERWQDRGRLEQ